MQNLFGGNNVIMYHKILTVNNTLISIYILRAAPSDKMKEEKKKKENNISTIETNHVQHSTLLDSP